MRTAHLARDENHAETVCGESWEHWQEPDQKPQVDPQELPYSARVVLGEAEEQRRQDRMRPVRQCQACFKHVIAGWPR